MTPLRTVGDRILAELAVMLRFGSVGLAATAVHVSVVWVLLTITSMHALLANLIAFTIAFGVSFAGNFLWTFEARADPASSMQRFALISLAAFLANSLLLSSLLRAGALSPIGSAVLSAAIVPAITFLASRAWGFRPRATPGTGVAPEDEKARR